MQLTLVLNDNPVLPHVRDRLLAAFGPQREGGGDPLDLFIHAMIASQTRDEVSWAVNSRAIVTPRGAIFASNSDPL
jgi:hypothetical protein